MKQTNHSRTPRKLFFGTACALTLIGSAMAERNYLAWGYRHDPDSPVSQNGVAVAMDRRGNVAVTGFTYANNKEIIYTARYDGLSGALIWQKSIISPFGNSRPTSVATDSQGNVIVTGYTTGAGTNFDYVTVKYMAEDGTIDWSVPYNNPNNSEDKAVKVVVDSNDDVIVTGSSVGSGTQADIRTFKYDGATGNQLWEIPYDSPNHYADKPNDLYVDALGNVAITGYSRVGADQCFYTAKYNGAAGTKIWDTTYDSDSGTDDNGVGVAIDPLGHVAVTGFTKNGNNYSYYTIKYAALNGNKLWDRPYSHPSEFNEGPRSLAVDFEGNVIVSGPTRPDNFKVTYYTAKYAAANGQVKWEASTPAEGGNDDYPNAMKVDAAGNVVVTGYSQNEDQTEDYYTVKYEGEKGGLLWEQRLNGATEGGKDVAIAVAVDAGGNVAITGTSKKPTNSTFEMLTVKYNRFLLTVGDPIAGPDLSPEAVVSSLNTPAIAQSGAIAARIGIKDGRARFTAILAQTGAGGNAVAALQGQEAPGVTGSAFKSFSDPVIAENGTFAFIGKISGVPGAESGGVWTNAFFDSLKLVLQTGKEVPGLESGVLLKSIQSISLHNGHLAALITVQGAGISKANSTVLVGLLSPTVGYKLAQTNDPITADGSGSTIKKLSVFAPTKSAPGHGRYHGTNARTVATATLADKRTVLLGISNLGFDTPLLTTNQVAGSIDEEARWKSFGPPAIASNGFNYTALAKLQPGLGGVTSSDDSVILASAAGNGFTVLAREGGDAAGANGADFAGFSDPISATGERYAFLGALKGDGVNGGNKSGLWFAASGTLNLVARTGESVPDAAGFETGATFASFSNFALPTSGPLFLAKVKGEGVNGGNNFGLWGVDSLGHVRQLLRNGDTLGDYTVKKFTLLNSVSGAFNATRSFNNGGGVAALVSFKDRTQALVFVGVP